MDGGSYGSAVSLVISTLQGSEDADLQATMDI